MTEFFKRGWQWKLTFIRLAIYVTVSVGNVVVSSMQNWTDDYVGSLRWWNWVVFFVTLMIAFASSVGSFIDKTFHTDQEKINGKEPAKTT
jgi:ABC-type multidrug transport system permease subunit